MLIEFLIIGFILGVLIIFFFQYRYQKYLKKKTSETFSDELREEIEDERERYYKNKEKFTQTLKNAPKKQHSASKIEFKP
jgi:Tfp pilus assembly protein PilE